MDKDSEDDQFYGHPTERLQLESRVQEFSASDWINRHGAWGVGQPARQASRAIETAKLHNPYAGVEYAWQLTETLDDFLHRLPPATTNQTEHVPWIFVCNPFVAREAKGTSDEAFMRGNEDEAPFEGGRQLSLVVQGATERLELLAELMQRLNASGKSFHFITRELSQERSNAVSDILHLAHAGRWMIFCPPATVNDLWELVARATANNELGIAAKVAPRPELNESTRDRLICIYTSDFMDKADVARVLQRMRELKIADSGRQNIYYKPGIAGGNPWGLAASIYSSREFLCS
ncbi:hypothetical protein E4U53_006164 [Claviceps sorghi]|nr:hypothetical protein E4U53_006164 [Claviceps sorghi]